MNRNAIMMMGVILSLAACRTEAPEHPDPGQLEWTAFIHPTLNYRLEYPTIYTVQQDGEDVYFRNEGHPSLVIHYGSRQKADKHGLWADHEPEETVRFASREWDAYDYNHRDAFFQMRTISFVTPYRDGYLSLDIRTDADLDEVHQKIIYSFTFQ